MRGAAVYKEFRRHAMATSMFDADYAADAAVCAPCLLRHDAKPPTLLLLLRYAITLRDAAMRATPFAAMLCCFFAQALLCQAAACCRGALRYDATRRRHIFYAMRHDKRCLPLMLIRRECCFI